MKAVKWVALAAGVYVLVVVLFESWLGVFQPLLQDSGIPMLVIETRDDAGNWNDRVLARIETDGKLYVAVNHWPRAWYRQALEDPEVRVTFDGGGGGTYTAVPLAGAEYARVDAARPLTPMVRFLTGFPPRRILRLDPHS